MFKRKSSGESLKQELDNLQYSPAGKKNKGTRAPEFRLFISGHVNHCLMRCHMVITFDASLYRCHEHQKNVFGNVFYITINDAKRVKRS